MFLLDICCQLLEKICKSLPHRSVGEDVCFKFTQGASHFSLKTISGHCESESVKTLQHIFSSGDIHPLGRKW